MTHPQAAIMGSLLAQLGFESVQNSTILTRLSKIAPSGNTALRDSTKTGLQLILQLNKSMLDLGLPNAFNFVHIIITDGIDTSSNTSLQELALMFALIGKGIPKERCLTVFIGVELNNEAIVQLALLKSLGGANCEIYNVSKVDLNSIFQRISATISVIRQTTVGMAANNQSAGIFVNQRAIPVLNLNRRNFAVMLNLDISGSMNGPRFNSLKYSVQNFLNNLDGNDLVSCIVFNDNVQLLKNYQPMAQVIRCATQ